MAKLPVMVSNRAMTLQPLIGHSAYYHVPMEAQDVEYIGGVFYGSVGVIDESLELFACRFFLRGGWFLDGEAETGGVLDFDLHGGWLGWGLIRRRVFWRWRRHGSGGRGQLLPRPRQWFVAIQGRRGGAL